MPELRKEDETAVYRLAALQMRHECGMCGLADGVLCLPAQKES